MRSSIRPGCGEEFLVSALPTTYRDKAVDHYYQQLNVPWNKEELRHGPRIVSRCRLDLNRRLSEAIGMWAILISILDDHVIVWVSDYTSLAGCLPNLLSASDIRTESSANLPDDSMNVVESFE